MDKRTRPVNRQHPSWRVHTDRIKRKAKGLDWKLILRVLIAALVAAVLVWVFIELQSLAPGAANGGA